MIKKRVVLKSVKIYVLKDPINFLIKYVGKTKQKLQSRLRQHLRQKSSDCRGYWIQSLVKKGLEPIIEEIESCFECNWRKRETFWIRHFKNLGFALTNGNEGGDGCGVVSDLTRKKIAAIHKGRKRSEETKGAISLALKGKVVSEQTREKLSNANKGRKRSVEVKKKLSDARKNYKHSEETKVKIGVANACRVWTEESKRKISIANTGNKHTEEWKKANSLRMKGRIVSEETRLKLRLAKLGKPRPREVVLKALETKRRKKLENLVEISP